jgi:hypothetical protein
LVCVQEKVNASVQSLFQHIDGNRSIDTTPTTSYDISRVANKTIFILDQPVDSFAGRPFYVDSIGELMYGGFTGLNNKKEVYEMYYRGFNLSESERLVIQRNIHCNPEKNTIDDQHLIRI